MTFAARSELARPIARLRHVGRVAWITVGPALAPGSSCGLRAGDAVEQP